METEGKEHKFTIVGYMSVPFQANIKLSGMSSILTQVILNNMVWYGLWFTILLSHFFQNYINMILLDDMKHAII